MTYCSALLLLSLRIVGTAALGTLQSFTIFSEPIFLRRGEVHNRALENVKPWALALPADIVQKFANKTMHLKNAQLVDIVLVDNKTGEKRSAPLYMTYNHHYALMVGPQEDLMQLYNHSKGLDPFDPSLYPNQTHAKHAHHGGCMMTLGARNITFPLWFGAEHVKNVDCNQGIHPIDFAVRLPLFSKSTCFVP
eukprot:s3242_g5.t1